MEIEENVPLASLTTLRVGGPARFLAHLRSEPDLVQAVEFARSSNLPVFVLGGGSNLLVADTGFNGLVLHMEMGGAVQFSDVDGVFEVQAAAGVDWDAFVLAACQRGLTGVECLAGIPGLVGGTPVQNVGAYGQEVAGTIVRVRALDLQRTEFVTLEAAECGFAYRTSLFNSAAKGRYVVTEVCFRLNADRPVELKYAELARHFAGRTPTPMEVYYAVREIRHRKGMLLVGGEADCRSAGSFFKNPVVAAEVLHRLGESAHVDLRDVPHWEAGTGKVKLAAAWLVEKAGFHKGFAKGRAGISSRHTLALVNLGNASAEEIIALRDEIMRVVYERFAVKLEQEPVMLG